MLYIGDVVEMRKPHPCGGLQWENRALVPGADIGLLCRTCKHRVTCRVASLHARPSASCSVVRQRIQQECSGTFESKDQPCTEMNSAPIWIKYPKLNEIKDYGPQGLQIEGRADLCIVGMVDAHQPCVDVLRRSDGRTFCSFITASSGVLPPGWQLWAGPVRSFITNDLNLYAAHLALDAYPDVGNNVDRCSALAWMWSIGGAGQRCQARRHSACLR